MTGDLMTDAVFKTLTYGFSKKPIQAISKRRTDEALNKLTDESNKTPKDVQRDVLKEMGTVLPMDTETSPQADT